MTTFVRSAAGAGAFTGTTLGWNMPVSGSTTIAFAPSAPTSTGPKINAYRSLPSSGLGPIVYNVVSAGITGSPLIDIVGYAELIALNPSRLSRGAKQTLLTRHSEPNGL